MTAPTAVPGIDDAHRGCPFRRWKPFRDCAGSGRKTTALAHTEQESACGQHHETSGQSVAGASERPKRHDYGKAATRSQKVHQLSAARVHQRVREQERRLEGGELPVAQRNVSGDRLHSDGQGLAVKVTDRDRSTDQDGDSPTQTGSSISEWLRQR